MDLIVSLSEGCSGADLKAICTEAGMFAIREERDTITNADFMDAIDKTRGTKHEVDFRIITKHFFDDFPVCSIS